MTEKNKTSLLEETETAQRIRFSDEGPLSKAKASFSFAVRDEMILRRFAGAEVDLGGNEHLIVKVEDILGVIETKKHKDQQEERG